MAQRQQDMRESAGNVFICRFSACFCSPLQRQEEYQVLSCEAIMYKNLKKKKKKEVNIWEKSKCWSRNPPFLKAVSSLSAVSCLGIFVHQSLSPVFFKVKYLWNDR